MALMGKEIFCLYLDDKEFLSFTLKFKELKYNFENFSTKGNMLNQFDLKDGDKNVNMKFWLS